MIQNRKKAQFNLLDALIVLFILAMIGTVLYGLFGGFHKQDTAKPAEFNFDVKIPNVNATALPLITEGALVKDSVTGAEIGTVVSVRTEKSRYYGGARADEDGNYSLSVTNYPNQYDVYVTVSAHADEDKRGIFYVGGIRMLIGETVHFQVKSFSAISYIVKTAAAE